MNTTRRPPLEVEALEARWVPDARTFVGGLYSQILHRNGSPAEIDSWVVQINRGLTALQVAQSFENSVEKLGKDVQGAFIQVLKHSPDNATLNSYIVQMQQGKSTSDILVQLFNSPEYQQAHSDVVSFVRGLYSDILGRVPDAAGAAFWQTKAFEAAGRELTIRGFLTSPERLGRAMDSFYISALGRIETPEERNFWISQGQQVGGALERIQVFFVSSQEFRRLAGYV